MGKAFYKKILENNKTWIAAKTDQDKAYFKRLEKGQEPPLLWIGCADSRVPTNTLLGAEPGEVFVHRNIANMVIHTDMNLLSVLDYAVNALKVEHIIVCGHYGCGGVKAAMSDSSVGLIDNWLRNIRDVYKIHQQELDAIPDEQKRWDKFVEFNVQEQVSHVAETSIVQQAWANKQSLTVHGWVYDIGSGGINDLEIDMSNINQLVKTHKLTL
ncbi:carbonic anhydrase [Mesonia hippocampi]|uniref:Carbonic anhydrase 2 n=1 Tax=Mesonia hippocampi TaxID=1628250 RepID=A0A840ENY3_9FLAO|nr:carbonic anhydrase [Mesonia hippocampi]MBB4118303.1 carbonic anhydrase [Mesonia hippocampi]